jgi:hypothetical protein
METPAVSALFPERTSSFANALVTPGEVLRTYGELTDTGLEGRIARAAETGSSYRKTPVTRPDDEHAACIWLPAVHMAHPPKQRICRTPRTT